MNGLAVADAVMRVRDGGLVAYPTETVWGLGADASRDDAVEALRRFKGRSDDAPIAVLVEGAGSLASLGFRVPQAALRLADRFWPGPLTLVMPCSRRLATGIARADGGVGVRCSPHPTAAALARGLAAAGAGPLTATSLNHSGDPAARNRREAAAVCGEGPEAPRLVVGDDAGGGAASTVVDVCGDRPAVLRWGALTETRLAPFLEEIAAA